MSSYTVCVRLSSKQKLNAFETLKLKFCSNSVRLRNGPVGTMTTTAQQLVAIQSSGWWHMVHTETTSLESLAL